MSFPSLDAATPAPNFPRAHVVAMATKSFCSHGNRRSTAVQGSQTKFLMGLKGRQAVQLYCTQAN